MPVFSCTASTNPGRGSPIRSRDFTASAPNRRYVGDITYLPLADGANLYPRRNHTCDNPGAMSRRL